MHKSKVLCINLNVVHVPLLISERARDHGIHDGRNINQERDERLNRQSKSMQKQLDMKSLQLMLRF